MTREEKLAYSRGYARGLQRRWPENYPPFPPDLVIAELMRATMKLRDIADAEAAKFEEGDELAERLWAGVDEVDAAMSAVTAWLKQQESPHA